jgi:ribosome-associated translation inhibitor RaiA
MRIVFKNLERSDFAFDAVKKRINTIISKFPQLNKDDLMLTLSKDTSSVHRGTGVFRVKLQVLSGKYKGVVLEKGSSNLYKALARTVDRTHERIKRFNEKRYRSKRYSHKYSMLVDQF